jgi:2-polyprenyl-6-methoxyphenol hydroxylase-like FAD-dependent oxidoreductase
VQHQESTSALIVGGGVVGLSAALLLQYHGVDFVVVERRSGPSVLPRSRGLHARTSEIFRQLGIEEQVQAASTRALKAGEFGGYRMGPTMLTSVAQPIPAKTEHFETPSPSSFCFLPQVELEPLLIDIARQRGADLRFGTELTTLRSHADGIEAIITQAGHERVIAADYVIAADGANSGIRTSLGITGWELPPTHHYVNVFFRADLADRVAGRTFSQCQIDNDTVHALMLSKNNTDEWSLHIEYDPVEETLADYPPGRCADLVRAAVGADEIDVDVLVRAVWDTGVHVANTYRHDRILLAGDAAHRHSPSGGFGANTGIDDVHNLVWKLAAVLSGRAKPALLDTYEPERRPQAVTGARQARLRTDPQTRFQKAGAPGAPAELIDMEAVMTRYRYLSPAVADPTSTTDHVAELRGQRGTRVPHLWLTRGERRISTLDLCGPGFAVITDVDHSAWADAARRAEAETGCIVAVHGIGDELVDTDRVWRTTTGLRDGAALLVRPDHHVAARSDEDLSPATLVALLTSVCCSTATAHSAS